METSPRREQTTWILEAAATVDHGRHPAPGKQMATAGYGHGTGRHRKSDAAAVQSEFAPDDLR